MKQPTKESMRNLLLRLEWSGRRATAPVGGSPMGSLPCCPICQGIDPNSRWKSEFIEEAVGHRALCDMAWQLR